MVSVGVGLEELEGKRGGSEVLVRSILLTIDLRSDLRVRLLPVACVAQTDPKNITQSDSKKKSLFVKNRSLI